MNDGDDGGQRITGRVKWFDPSKGFGFVIADEGGPDILLHANVLRNFGQSSIADGAGVEVIAQKTARGVQAVEVLAIDPAKGDDGEDTDADGAIDGSETNTGIWVSVTDRGTDPRVGDSDNDELLDGVENPDLPLSARWAVSNCSYCPFVTS